jgi:hypothetical protein
VLGIATEGEQRVGDSPEEQRIDHTRVALREGVEIVRECDDDVEVRNRQEVSLPRAEPSFLRGRLAFGTVAIATANGELTISCLMESARFWGVRASSRFHTLDLRPIRHAVHSP